MSSIATALARQRRLEQLSAMAKGSTTLAACYHCEQRKPGLAGRSGCEANLLK